MALTLPYTCTCACNTCTNHTSCPAGPQYMTNPIAKIYIYIYRFPRNLATYFSQLVPINAALENVAAWYGVNKIYVHVHVYAHMHYMCIQISPSLKLCMCVCVHLCRQHPRNLAALKLLPHGTTP